MRTNITVLADFLRHSLVVRHWVVTSSMVAVAGCPGALPDVVSDATDGDSSSVTGQDADTTVATLETAGSTGTTEVGDPDTEPGCGNGLVEAGETCDAGGESATCDADCTDVVCGDSSVNSAADEACEETDLAGATCRSLGFDGGTLACSADCVYDVTDCEYAPPGQPVLELSYSQVKRFDFSWLPAAGAEYYQLVESSSPGEPFVQIGGDIFEESTSVVIPLHRRFEASYLLRACNSFGRCTDSEPVSVMSNLVEAIGYFKASNTGPLDYFGASLALSGDGRTLAVGAILEDSIATGIDGDQTSAGAIDSGSVYVFTRDELGGWSQQAYIKATNTDAGDYFGFRLSLSNDGNTLAVSALNEDSDTTGINGNQADNTAGNAGAAYVFVRDESGEWSQQAYVKASNAEAGDLFGVSVALNADGDTLAVGARHEASAATGVADDPVAQANNDAPHAGAAYVFVHDAAGVWTQEAYLKASNTGPEDIFGYTIAISGDGDTLAVGALYEDSAASGINGAQNDESATDAGAVYVFTRDGAGQWSQQAYVKASNPEAYDVFGHAIALNGNGDVLVVGAPYEDSSAWGIDGEQDDNETPQAGAAYVFVHDPLLNQWAQQAYVKASNPGGDDTFGIGVALDGTGSVLAVASPWEDGGEVGVGGNPYDNSQDGSGSVYVFVRDPLSQWSEHVYLKAPNAAIGDNFGVVALSSDGTTLAVGAHQEDSSATGVGGNQSDEAALDAGAVYLY